MANTELRLSSVLSEDGKSQIIVKLTISRSQRPCFKSGIYIRPEYFKPVKTTARGSIMGIVPPKKGKLNFVEVSEAETAKTSLEVYISRMLKICQVTEEKNKDLLTKEWVEKCILASSELDITDISFKALTDAIEKLEAQEDATNEAEKKSFFELFEEYLKEKASSDSWVKNNKVLFRDLARWEAYVQFKHDKTFTLDVDTLTKENISDFRDYLRSEKTISESCPKFFKKILKEYPTEIGTIRKSPKLVDRGSNSIVILMKKFKAFFSWLNKTERTKNMPFLGIEIGSEVYGTPFYLTTEERNIIAKHDFEDNKMLSEQRDIFVFQCLIGCRVSDLMKFTADNITNGILSYVPQKTKDESPRVVRVPLLPYALELIKKYEGVDEKGRLFPFISSQKYNDNIKKIIKACGIDRMVIVRNSLTGNNEAKPISEVASSHMARRTFIGGLYEGIKDPNIIAKMSGHVEGSKAFNRYRDISDNTLKDALKNIDF